MKPHIFRNIFLNLDYVLLLRKQLLDARRFAFDETNVFHNSFIDNVQRFIDFSVNILLKSKLSNTRFG